MAFITEREIVSFVTEIGRVDVHAFPSLYAKAQFICSVEFCPLCCLIPLYVIFPGKTSDSVHLIADLVRCLRIVLLAHPLPPGRFIRPAVANKDGGGLTKKGLCNRHQIIEQRWRIRELVLGFGGGSHSWARSKFRPLLFKAGSHIIAAVASIAPVCDQSRSEHGRSKRSRSPQSPQALTIVYVMFSYNRPNRKTTF